MKSTHRTQCSLVPWAKAGARRAARMPSRPPAMAAATPVVRMKLRRFSRVSAAGGVFGSVVSIWLYVLLDR